MTYYQMRLNECLVMAKEALTKQEPANTLVCLDNIHEAIKAFNNVLYEIQQGIK